MKRKKNNVLSEPILPTKCWLMAKWRGFFGWRNGAYVQIKRWPSGRACAGWGCRTGRSVGGRACTDRASRPSESACVWWASTNQKRPSCTCDTDRAAHPSASSCGSWRMSFEKNVGRRSDIEMASRLNESVRGPSDWLPGWKTCDSLHTDRAVLPNASSCESWACWAERTSCRRLGIDWLFLDHNHHWAARCRPCCCCPPSRTTRASPPPCHSRWNWMTSWPP